MRNRGRPLSRTMIVEHVWDMDYDGLTNIVDVYIRHLRSKIDDKWPEKMIQTVRGIGYMLDTPEQARTEKESDEQRITMRPRVRSLSRPAFPPDASATCCCSSRAAGGHRTVFPPQPCRFRPEGDVRAVLEEEWGAAKGYLHIENYRPEWICGPDRSGRSATSWSACARNSPDRRQRQCPGGFARIRFDRHRFALQEIRRIMALPEPKFHVRTDSDGMPYMIKAGLMLDDHGERYFSPSAARSRTTCAPSRTSRATTFLSLLAIIPLTGLLGWALAGRAIQPVN